MDPLHIDLIWMCQDKSFSVIHEKLTRILMESNVILVLGNSVGNGILKEGDYLDYTPIPLTMVGDTNTVGNHRHVKKGFCRNYCKKITPP